MRFMVVTVFLAAITMLHSTAGIPGATYTNDDGTTYFVSPGLSGARCMAVRGGGMQCTGADGASAIVSQSGCGMITGSAICVVVTKNWPAPDDGPVLLTSTLECAKMKYQLSTGREEGTCTANDGVDMRCGDSNGNEAAASCEMGCAYARGAGSCLIVGKKS